MTLQDLADWLLLGLDRLVYDKTGIPGKYDFHLEYSVDENGTLIPEKVSNTPSVPELPKLDITKYHYEYDQYENWTEQTVVHRSDSNEYSTVRHRTFTYY